MHACRIHQFEKVEQFFVTSCNNNASWEAFEEMLSNAEDFYTSLGLHYQVGILPFVRVYLLGWNSLHESHSVWAVI